MKIYMVIFLCLSSGFLPTGWTYLKFNSAEKFSDAVEECDNRGLELLTMSTYRQYLDAQEYFQTNSPGVSWLALEENTTTGNYQWLNGQVLTELKWESGEPVDYTGTDCGAIDVYSKEWHSTLCTNKRHYICVGSDGSSSISSIKVNFYTAVLSCQSEGRRLPVAITNLDKNWLNTFIQTNSLTKDIWLGLMESGTQPGDYYKWVTGEHLTPPFTWADSNRFPTVQYRHSGVNKGFQCSALNKQKYVCQSPEATAVVRSLDKFVFVSNNAIVLGSIRKTTTINSVRRFQCALECLQDTGCIQYTIQGYLCRTFGESLVITDYSRGHMLWQRKIIS